MWVSLKGCQGPNEWVQITVHLCGAAWGRGPGTFSPFSSSHWPCLGSYGWELSLVDIKSPFSQGRPRNRERNEHKARRREKSEVSQELQPALPCAAAQTQRKRDTWLSVPPLPPPPPGDQGGRSMGFTGRLTRVGIPSLPLAGHTFWPGASFLSASVS